MECNLHLVKHAPVRSMTCLTRNLFLEKFLSQDFQIGIILVSGVFFSIFTYNMTVIEVLLWHFMFPAKMVYCLLEFLQKKSNISAQSEKFGIKLLH